MNNDKSRREFLKGAAAVAGAALTANAIGSRAYAGSDDLIRVGMIGCGGRGSGAANQTLSVPNSKVKIVAMADAFDNKIKGAHDELSKKHGDKVDVPAGRMFSGLDAFNKVLEHCDMVILATPPGFRPQHFEAAVNAGKNIFMEKPVCVDSNGARKVLEMAKKADEKGLKVVCGLQRHYQNVYREAYKRVQDGLIGDIISAQVYWNQGDIWYRDRDDSQNEIQFQVNNWYHFNWLCGDHICEQHVHNLDVANWFIGAHPISASGMGGRTDKRWKTEIFDHHYVEFRYPGNIVVSSQCRQIAGTKNDVREEIHGTKGIMYLGNGHATDYKGNTLWKYEPMVAGKHDPDPYQIEHNELHGFIRDNQKVNNAYYTLDSTFTAVLGRTATYTGQEWKWDDLWKKDYGTFPKEGPSWDTKMTNHDKNGNYSIPVPGQYSIDPVAAPAPSKK